MNLERIPIGRMSRRNGHCFIDSYQHPEQRRHLRRRRRWRRRWRLKPRLFVLLCLRRRRRRMSMIGYR